MLAEITHFLPITAIRRERLLPLPGKVLVRKGQKVSATDVVAEAKVHPEHLLLDVARGLGLQYDQADRYIQFQADMRVAQGDVLAGPVGWTKRVVRSPRGGRVVLAGDGKILIELDSAPFELRAGVPGTVIELIENRGVIIETSGALIQGVWGNGRIDYGLMSVIVRSPDDTLITDRMDVSMRGGVVVGGFCNDLEVLRMAESLPLRGLVLASMDASLLSEAARMSIPLMVMEGFGKLAMNDAAFKLLTTNDKREAALNAENWDRFKGVRPEIVIPLPASGSLKFPREVGYFEAGQQVRILRPPHKGKIGTLIAVQPGLNTLSNGVQTKTGVVQLESGDEVVIALVNCEILE